MGQRRLRVRFMRRLSRLLGLDPGLETLDQHFPGHAIGRGSYGGLSVPRYPGDAKLVMGAYCSIAEDVTVMLGGEHRIDWVTTYPFNGLWSAGHGIEGHPITRGDVVIGNDVWIAREAMILSGVTIGDGAVIGARAIVRSDVPPYGVVAGNPGKLVKMRFDDATVARLLEIAWWSWPKERIERALPDLLSADISGFIAKVDAGTL